MYRVETLELIRDPSLFEPFELVIVVGEVPVIATLGELTQSEGLQECA